jgi:hypothetical protein
VSCEGPCEGEVHVPAVHRCVRVEGRREKGECSRYYAATVYAG